jgi:membrane-bound metal-dependent hydrolase YbcI (DUF457 family)
MENLAHTLCGLRIADLGWRARVGPAAPWFGAIAANLPDADLVLYLGGPDVYTWWHRGITHSVFGWPMLALAGAEVSRRLSRQGGYRDHLGLWAVGLLSHALLDWPTTWGTMLFLPATDTRFSLDWIFIVDPMFWVTLWALPAWLRPRVGAERAARTGLWALAGWVLFCGAMQQQAARQADEPNVAVFPSPLAPLHWVGVREEGDVVRRWFLTPSSAERQPDLAALTRDERAALRTIEPGERWLWKTRAPAVLERSRVDPVIVVDPATGASETVEPARIDLSLVDLSYTSWASAEPSVVRFGGRFVVHGDGRVERVSQPGE